MTDLTDRMRTCAAAILMHKDEGPPWDGWDAAKVVIDAADLLIEASNIIEATTPQPEPMEIIPPVVTRSPASEESMRGTWITAGDTLPKPNPYRGRHTCPRCDSRAGKRVYREGNHLMLACPVCGHAWEFKKTAGMTGG